MMVHDALCRGGSSLALMASLLARCAAVSSASCPSCASRIGALMCSRLGLDDGDLVCSYRAPQLSGRAWRTNETYCGCGFPYECNSGAHSWLAHPEGHEHRGSADHDHDHDVVHMFQAGTCRAHTGHVALIAVVIVLFWAACVFVCCIRPKHLRKVVPAKPENVPS